LVARVEHAPRERRSRNVRAIEGDKLVGGQTQDHLVSARREISYRELDQTHRVTLWAPWEEDEREREREREVGRARERFQRERERGGEGERAIQERERERELGRARERFKRERERGEGW
jgi:hypothetical protein